MSIRYGVELLFDPAFSAGAYRIRQAVCSQYSSWAAEMHMLRMQLVPYFECPEDSLPVLNARLADLAGRVRRDDMYFERVGFNIHPSDRSVTLDFADNASSATEMFGVSGPGPSWRDLVPGLGRRNRPESETAVPAETSLSGLHQQAAEVVAATPGAVIPPYTFRQSIVMLEFGDLAPDVLEDAAEYARGAAAGVELSFFASVWRLMLLRYSSEAAGEDWSNGSWAPDVSWRPLYTYRLGN